MVDEKKRSKALKIVVGLDGVTSASVDGKEKDQIVVVGDGIDSFALVRKLRKRMKYAELLSVAPADEKKEEAKVEPIGVTSASVDGKEKDQIVVVGDGIDSFALVRKLRKRMKYAELLSVAPADEKKEEAKVEPIDGMVDEQFG
ncbi:hypothetical protein COCNU_scaffold016239G000010 [Cocos nucifera]|nr:hypothetical protein [Cocos nucifera]